LALGDYFDVTLRDTIHPDKIRVQATRVGSSVYLDEGEAQTQKPGQVSFQRAASPFVTVMELDKANQPIRTFKFAKDTVLVIEQGHAKIARKK
jgi:hypothetical protein